MSQKCILVSIQKQSLVVLAQMKARSGTKIPHRSVPVESYIVRKSDKVGSTKRKEKYHTEINHLQIIKRIKVSQGEIWSLFKYEFWCYRGGTRLLHVTKSM